MLWLSSFFFWSYFPVFGIIFIFQTFGFFGFGFFFVLFFQILFHMVKLYPLYLNRVVRLTTMHIIIIAKIDSWTLGKSPRMQSWPNGPMVLMSSYVKSCFAKWRLTRKRGDDLKFLSRVEIIGEIRCSPHYDPFWYVQKAVVFWAWFIG